MNAQKNRNRQLFDTWSIGKKNYLIFGISLITIVVGYIVMATGETDSVQSIRVAPIILVIGYCVLLPISILVNNKD
tara:strand:- start:338 stop:565 length:228 start_codon:yes stop_codon:yes gene_type:complete